ncbi:MAG: hypothetical protein H0T14_09340 [Nocardioidaceae bacterium]|nr:hypothetical protein [Nocardioidaceae bacterium]
MTAPPNTVYIHIGLHKTGTTYLQNMLRVNREEVRRQQIEFTGGPGEPSQKAAVWDLHGRRLRDVDDRFYAGKWDSLVEHINSSGLPRALISEERLALSTLKQARRVVDAFPAAEIHVVATARDLGRVAVSAWQEEIKSNSVWTWQEFVTSIKDTDGFAKNPARNFWLRQDLPTICETWESVVPSERLHVVTVPLAGSPPEVLLERFCSVIGIDASALTEQPAWTNETVGVPATEVIRRVNERLAGSLNQRQYDRVVKGTLVPLMARRIERALFSLSEADREWADDRAASTIAALKDRGYPIVGDLEELRPRWHKDSRRPDDLTTDELLDTSLEALALLAEAHATSWWVRKRPDNDETDASESLGSKVRATVFRTQSKGADLADRNPVAAKALGAVLKSRQRARLKARDRFKS